MFAWVTLEDQDYITFFKSNYQSRFLVAQDENSAVHWTLNHMILPGPSPKVNEYFYLNLNVIRRRYRILSAILTD